MAPSWNCAHCGTAWDMSLKCCPRCEKPRHAPRIAFTCGKCQTDNHDSKRTACFWCRQPRAPPPSQLSRPQRPKGMDGKVPEPTRSVKSAWVEIPSKSEPRCEPHSMGQSGISMSTLRKASVDRSAQLQPAMRPVKKFCATMSLTLSVGSLDLDELELLLLGDGHVNYKYLQGLNGCKVVYQKCGSAGLPEFHVTADDEAALAEAKASIANLFEYVEQSYSAADLAYDKASQASTKLPAEDYVAEREVAKLEETLVSLVKAVRQAGSASSMQRVASLLHSEQRNLVRSLVQKHNQTSDWQIPCGRDAS